MPFVYNELVLIKPPWFQYITVRSLYSEYVLIVKPNYNEMRYLGFEKYMKLTWKRNTIYMYVLCFDSAKKVLQFLTKFLID